MVSSPSRIQTGQPAIHVFIQARMSSKRFPGKVLAPLAGRPLIAHVISQVGQLIPPERIVVATSIDESDGPLACYVREIGINVYRGPLDNVFYRFQLCLQEYPCSWFFRVCADSPILDNTLLRAAMAYSSRRDVDLVTNVFPRTFPKGQSVEMLNAATFAAIDPSRLTLEEQEHMTQVYYSHAGDFRIINIESADQRLANKSFAVDTVEDILRLEQMLQARQGSPLRMPFKVTG